MQQINAAEHDIIVNQIQQCKKLQRKLSTQSFLISQPQEG